MIRIRKPHDLAVVGFIVSKVVCARRSARKAVMAMGNDASMNSTPITRAS
jgi:hypothetical protein